METTTPFKDDVGDIREQFVIIALWELGIMARTKMAKKVKEIRRREKQRRERFWGLHCLMMWFLEIFLGEKRKEEEVSGEKVSK